MASRQAPRLLLPTLKSSCPASPRTLTWNCSSRKLIPLNCLLSSLQCQRYGFPAQAPTVQQQRYANSDAAPKVSPEELQKLPLHDMHAQYGAKFVPFGGYHMPIQYSNHSISDSHHWTRSKASLFDVSHMVTHTLTGTGAASFLERITTAPASTLAQGQSTLTTLLHRDTGGIVDDTIVARDSRDRFIIVTNAGTREKDQAYLRDELHAWNTSGAPETSWKVLNQRALIALQGPLAAQIIEQVLATDPKTEGTPAEYLKSFGFGDFRLARFNLGENDKPEITIARAGYTGEDGFEIGMAASHAEPIVKKLFRVAGENLKWAGLGARDTLRLEAGMCLYGHDLDDTTTPIEAGLAWTIPKSRRETGGFHGDSVILEQLKKKSEGGGVTRRRVGFVVEGAPAREGAEIVDAEGKVVGKITSGCPSPTIGKNIAMGYIKDGLHKSGTEVEVLVRGKKRKATVTKMPFVPPKYYKPS